MGALRLLLILVVIGFALWAIPLVIPMDATVWMIARAGVLLVVIVLVIMWLLGSPPDGGKWPWQ
jgi:hypothetical protein